MRGDSGDDGLTGGAGDDTLEGGEGADVLFGGDFTPQGAFAPGSGVDTLLGGPGNDGLWGFDGNDILTGSGGDDYIEGNDGDDVIEGVDGDDTILAGPGADILAGGQGFDYLYGGAGADTFILRNTDRADAIWDFNPGEGDQLLLDPFLQVTSFADFRSKLTGFVFEGADYTVFTVATVDGGETFFDQWTIKGVAANAWTEAMVLL
jgi:Ca2+-binding RTX toxin-like protein